MKTADDALLRLGLPRRYLSARAEDFRPGLRPDPARGFFVHGETGSGKTRLLAAALRRVVEGVEVAPAFRGWDHELALWDARAADGAWRRLPAAFVSAPDLMAAIKATFRRDASLGEEDVVRKHAEVPLLFLDDLGAQLDTDWSLSALDRIVDRRWGEELPLCASSNLSLEALRDGRGMDRIVSRVVGSCAEAIELAGRDRRHG